MAAIAKGAKAYAKMSVKAANAAVSGAKTMLARTKAKQAAVPKTTAAEVTRKKAEAEARILAQSKQKAAEAAVKAKAKAAKTYKTAGPRGARKEAGHTNAKTGVVLLKWHDVQFYAKSNQVRGLKSFTVSSSIETEDEEIGNEKITKLKKKKGYTSSITAYFDIRLGISNVKAEAMKLLAYGTGGQTGYLTCCGAKLIPTIQMMKDAKVQNVVFAPDGRWISCEVVMNFVNRSKLDGTTTGAAATSGGGDGSGSGGGGGGGGGGKIYSATVYYSASSGAVQSVTRTSTVSYNDALKKAYAAVPKNAQWASTDKKGATNQSPSPSNTPAATQAKTVAATVQKAAQKAAAMVKPVVTTVQSIVSKIGSLFK